MMEEGFGTPFVIFLRMMESFFALGLGDRLINHGLGRMREFCRRVGVHLF
jgi:hypothetical protein